MGDVYGAIIWLAAALLVCVPRAMMIASEVEDIVLVFCWISTLCCAIIIVPRTSHRRHISYEYTSFGRTIQAPSWQITHVVCYCSAQLLVGRLRTSQ